MHLECAPDGEGEGGAGPEPGAGEGAAGEPEADRGPVERQQFNYYTKQGPVL